MILASGCCSKWSASSRSSAADLGGELGDRPRPARRPSEPMASATSGGASSCSVRSAVWISIGSFVDAALAAAAPQRRGDLRARQAPAQRRGRRDGQARPARRGAEVIERFERGRVELPQRRAQLVELALPSPDHGLVGPGQDLDRFGRARCHPRPADGCGVGAGQLGQHERVARVGLRARGRVPLPIARDVDIGFTANT